MPHPFELAHDPIEINQGETPKITGQLVDHSGAALTLAQLGTLTLTLYAYDLGIKGILNNRRTQDVLNANNVTVDANGAFTWQLAQDDSGIANPNMATREREVHIARFDFTWGSSPVKKHSAFFEFRVLKTEL